MSDLLRMLAGLMTDDEKKMYEESAKDPKFAKARATIKGVLGEIVTERQVAADKAAADEAAKNPSILDTLFGR